MTIVDMTCEALEIRAAAHATGWPLRAAQKWQHRVTDEAVAVVMYSIERGDEIYRNRAQRWHTIPPIRAVLGRDLTIVVNEMVRTGLVRVLDETLVPALVHVRDGQWSACRFTGEDIGPIRSRLVDANRLDLVDCLECLASVARGGPRGL